MNHLRQAVLARSVLLVSLVLMGGWARAGSDAGVKPILVILQPSRAMAQAPQPEVLTATLARALAAAGLEVMGHGGIEAPLHGVLDAHEVALDEVSSLALLMAFDVRVRWQVHHEADEGSEPRARWLLSLEASQPSTGRLLGAQACVSRTYPPADAPAAEVALAAIGQECAGELAAKLARSRELREVRPVGGRHGQFVFLRPPGKFDFKARALFRKSCASAEVIASTRGLVVIHAHCPQDDPGLLTLVREAMEQAGGVQPKRILHPVPGVWVAE
jgi:hypothetical protein